MKPIMNIQCLNKALIDKLLGLGIKTEEDLIKFNSVDVYIQMEKKYKDVSLHMLWILDQAISEAKKNIKILYN